MRFLRFVPDLNPSSTTLDGGIFRNIGLAVLKDLTEDRIKLLGYVTRQNSTLPIEANVRVSAHFDAFINEAAESAGGQRAIRVRTQSP